MGVINFSKTNCQNCYACVRSCPVKAIKIIKGQAEILDVRCIACGLCLQVCPRNAKKVQSELDKVKSYIKQRLNIAVSLAPTYVSIFGEQSLKVVSLLKRLNFTYVEETVVGAEIITKAYEQYKDNYPHMACITSCCPSVNLLIEKHYPQNIPHLIPVISPMVCHARMLKEKYGKETKVVFIGPCLSKKLEGIDEYSVDAVLTFDELINWIQYEQINLYELEVIPFDATQNEYRQYPVVGGIGNHFKDKKVIHVDGLLECINMLEELNIGKFNDCLIEMSACRHSCIGGSAMPNDGISVFERKIRVQRYQLNTSEKFKNNTINEYTFSISKRFNNLSYDLKQPTPSELEIILNSMGKYRKDDQLNCGTCGYNTCYEKAVAIYNHMAEANMCLPFLKNKAETLANVLFDMTPNIVLIIDSELKVIEFNPAAEHFFNLKKNLVIGMPVSMVLNDKLFNAVLMNKKNILGKKQCINNGNSYVIQSIVWVDYQEVMLCIINNITEAVKKEEWMKNLKINAVNMAQEVINKQMRVAQEIASLLGETTAETKVTLTRLKELIQEDEVDLR